MDFKKYKLLGVCNSPCAYQALLAEDKIGNILSCNAIEQELSDRIVGSYSIDLVSFIQAIDHSNWHQIAKQIRIKLKLVIDSL